MSNEECKLFVPTGPGSIWDFYQHCLPKIRSAAKKMGYAVGVHGSMKRDLDLIAVPWEFKHEKKLDNLARAIQKACCQVCYSPRAKFKWETKPHGRKATILTIGFGVFIDLSVIQPPDTTP